MTYDFRPLDWTHATNIYEVNIRQYTREGSFKAFMPELPRLRDMGVETLWFMPITPISQKNKKGVLGSYYAASDYTSINPEFGTLDDFRILVKTAQQQGFRVIIDWVANHTGWDHKWTREHPDYYEKDPATQDFKRASGMDDIIELNFHNPELVRAMVDAMIFWVEETSIDGFRCDLAFWVELEFWQQARQEIDAIKPLFWLGELDPIEHPEYMGVFDVAYTWSWMHKTEEFYKGRLPLSALDSCLEQYEAIGSKTMRAWFTSNHDENSWNGSEYEKYGELAKALAVFSCTWNGIPLVYSGQELPNQKRLKFFEKDQIQWSGTYGLHDFYKTLLRLHSFNPALRAGDPDATVSRVQTGFDESILSYRCRHGNDEVLVALNFSSNHVQFNLSDVQGRFREVFLGTEKDFSADRNLEMNGWAFLVFDKLES
jgi:alpha-amylase